MADEIVAQKNRVTATIHLLICAAACWPVWVWAVQRMRDRSDDPWGMFAALAAFLAAGIAVRAPGIRSVDLRQAVLVSSCLVVYAISRPFVPMLVSGGFAVTAVALLISRLCYGNRLHLPTWGLLLLSLPVVATMQFYLGFPLRLFVTHVVAGLVNIAAFNVHIAGTDLVWQTHVVGIDPACSGVKMLWTAYFVAFTAALLHRLNNARSAALCTATLGIAIIGNVLRATMLFLLEVVKTRSAIPLPEFLHSGLGIVLFAFIAVSISLLASRRRAGQAPPLHDPREARTGGTCHARATMPLLIAATLACFIAPQLVSLPSRPASALRPAMPFPASFEGRRIRPVPLTKQESLFNESFPGAIAKFTDGSRQIVVRQVFHPTRQLHPSADCFRAIGYKTHELPNFRDPESGSWGRFEATNEELKLAVRERIADTAGNSWTDVSSWYWSAALGKSHGPWFAYTVAERASQQ
jgi:exosortase/archaeosortase family protein